MAQPSGRVLIIDDNPETVALIKAQLERAGYVVETANSGRVGLDMAMTSPPDVALVDVMMRGMNGHEVCRRLKAHPATRAVPALVLTALRERTDKIQALEAGADDFLSKPVDRAELLARVGSLVRLKRVYDDLVLSRDEVAHQAAQIATERATLHSVLESITDGVLMVEGSQRVRFCNDRAAQLLGVEPASAEGGTLEAVFAQLLASVNQPDDVRAAWTQALADPGARHHLEVIVARPVHRELLVEVFPMIGTAQGTFGILLRDVTQERAAERLKDELVSVVSHELRTPLASLVGFAELLLVRDFGEAERREFLTIMLEEGRRLTTLINDFLDLQRMESGRQSVTPTPLELREVVDRAVSTSGDDRQRPFVVDLPDDLPRVLADDDRVLQVLTNLLSNARKFSPAGGPIEIQARTITPANRYPIVEVSVRDQGLGLPPEGLTRVFEKFYRVDNSDRREIKGTGLGLAICRQIVEAHGGRIWAESEGLGKGACVRFTLPIAAADGREGDVLVVEDDPGFARLIAEELSALQLSSVRVPSAEAALQRLAVDRPRAIVLDLLLPGQDGEVVLPSLQRAMGATVPVVVVTVKDLSPDERATLASQGVAAILRKEPGVAARAARTVQETLGGPSPSPSPSGRGLG